MSRRAARLLAVEILYAADVRQEPAAVLLAEHDDADPYCSELVAGVERRKLEIDGLIGSHARGWTTERMSPVDRNVMRVAVLEILEGDVPAAVAIDEAVEIGKRFSGEEAGRFVNGVLEAVRQTVGGTAGASGSDGEGSDAG